MNAIAAAATVTALTGWRGTATGLTVIGACVVLGIFAPRMFPRRWARAHPWLHRLIAVLMYSGACALLFTPIGHGLIQAADAALTWHGALRSGPGHAAVVIAGLLMLLIVALALTTEPHPRAGWYAVILVAVLAVVPGGVLHLLLAATEAPGAAAAAAFSSLLGGN
jgi:hypothetical protein